ncbi:hypothetical protein ES705_03890 [subsurface metagenome]
MKWANTWFKKLYHAGNTRKGCFIMGTLIGLFTGLSKSVISINQGEPVIIAFLYGILFSIMWATPLFVTGIIRYPKSKGKKDP